MYGQIQTQGILTRPSLNLLLHGSDPRWWSVLQANDWASEYQREQETDPQGWAEEFSQSQGPKDWADEFGDQVAKGAFEGDESGWVDSYNQFLDESRGGETSTSNMCVCLRYIFFV